MTSANVKETKMENPTGRAIVIAHRGASGYRPEHTEAAYRLASILGADAVEPDIVTSLDGVLVIRHDNNISDSTDIAERHEYRSRRQTKVVDGTSQDGWFTEDFTWDELRTLRCKEPFGNTRPVSAAFDGMFPMLRLADLLDLLPKLRDDDQQPLKLVTELKHPTYYAALGFPLVDLYAEQIAEHQHIQTELVTECFESAALVEVQRKGVAGKRVYLIEAEGTPFDRASTTGTTARSYTDDLTPQGLLDLSEMRPSEHKNQPASHLSPPTLSGISVDIELLTQHSEHDTSLRGADLVTAAHNLGLSVFGWTLRGENEFISPHYRRSDTPSYVFGNWHDAFTAVLATGIDGVFADQPDLALTARMAAKTSLHSQS